MIDPARLSHVRWIGGPPDAGKTTVAQLLADRHELAWYRMDAHEMRHIRHAAERDPFHYPLNAAIWNAFQADPQAFSETWVSDDPAARAASSTASWIERIGLIAEDLAAMDDGIVIAEGPAFYPDAILPLLTDRHHAAWLVPDEDFKRASHARRDKTAFAAATSDPERAVANHIARDLIMADHYRTRLTALGLDWITVDHRTTPDAVADTLGHHFGL